MIGSLRIFYTTEIAGMTEVEYARFLCENNSVYVWNFLFCIQRKLLLYDLGN